MNTSAFELSKELATDVYLVFAIVLMFLLPVGQYFQWSGVLRQKHRASSLSLLLCLFGLTAVASYIFGYWISQIFTTGPGITGGFGDASNAWPWSDALAPHVGRFATTSILLRWVVFFLISLLVASLVVGSILERARGIAILLLGLGAAGVFWPIGDAWLWSSQSWMVKLVGFHDAFGAAAVHALAGGFALGILVNIKPRIAAHDTEDGAAMPYAWPWAAGLGCILFSVGLLGLSLSTLSFGLASTGPQSALTVTGAFGTSTSFGTVLANFAMALAGGLLSGHAKHGGNLTATAAGGIAGLVAVAAAADVYHPLQAFLIAAALSAVGLWWRERLARKYGIDDVTGVVALHGLVGCLGVTLAGFVLWTFPASPAADFARINPFGQFVGAVFAFGLFGFLPGYLIARFLKFLDILQGSGLSELAGQDLLESLEAYDLQRKAIQRELSFAKLESESGD